MNMEIGVSMSFPDFRTVDMIEPVICNYLARYIQDKPAKRVSLIGIGINSPVDFVKILVDRGGNVYKGLLIGS